MSKATRIAICLALLLPAVICGATETDRLEIRLRGDTSLTGEVPFFHAMA